MPSTFSTRKLYNIIVGALIILLAPTTVLAHGNMVAVFTFSLTNIIFIIAVLLILFYKFGAINIVHRIIATITVSILYFLFYMTWNAPYNYWYPYIDIADITLAMTAIIGTILILNKGALRKQKDIRS